MSINISIDDDLIKDALELSKISSKNELLEVALREFIQNQKRLKLLELKGKIEFFEDYNYKSMRGTH